MIQIRGVIEKKFYCILPEPFVLSELATMDGIVEAIKNGGLTEAQKSDLETVEMEMLGLMRLNTKQLDCFE